MPPPSSRRPPSATALQISCELRKLLTEPGHTPQPAALIHEAYLRLAGPEERTIEGRTRFFAAAAPLVRQILAELAGAGAATGGLSERQCENFLAADQALKKLAGENRRKAAILELRMFGGLQPDQIAAVKEFLLQA